MTEQPTNFQQAEDVIHGDAYFIEKFEPYREGVEEIATAGYSILANHWFRGYEHFSSSYPNNWQARYEARGYQYFDPVALWTTTNEGDIRWSAIQFPDTRGIFREARTYGLNFGAAFSRRNGRKVCLLSVAREDREVSHSELVTLSNIANNYFHDVGENIVFTELQINILKCLMNDKDLSSTARELGCSVSNVKSSLARARKAHNMETNYGLLGKAMRFNLVE
ncbi:MAG: autoinducer binding domain-containing protein [Bacteroidota bacterium]